MDKIKQVSSILEKKGITTETIFNCGLRHSWYTDKLEELGFNTTKVNLCHLSCGGFICELSNGLLCTGGNAMLVDALLEIGFHFNITYPYDIYGKIEGVQLYLADEDDDTDVLVTFTIENLQEYLDNI